MEVFYACIFNPFCHIFSHYLYDYTDMAKKFLNNGDNGDSLVELAESEHYASNMTIQRCVFNIVLKERNYQKGL